MPTTQLSVKGRFYQQNNEGQSLLATTLLFQTFSESNSLNSMFDNLNTLTKMTFIADRVNDVESKGVSELLSLYLVHQKTGRPVCQTLC